MTYYYPDILFRHLSLSGSLLLWRLVSAIKSRCHSVLAVCCYVITLVESVRVKSISVVQWLGWRRVIDDKSVTPCVSFSARVSSLVRRRSLGGGDGVGTGRCLHASRSRT